MRVSGWLLRAQYLYLRGRGATEFQQTLSGLTPDTQEFLRRGFLETSWYPDKIFLEVAHEAAKHIQDPEEKVWTDMGRHSCELALNSSHRLLFRFGDVDWLIERSSKAWASNFDEGRVEVRKTGGGAVIVELVNAPSLDPAMCFGIKGWMERAAEMSGEDSFECTMRIDPPGEALCSWRFGWTERAEP